MGWGSSIGRFESWPIWPIWPIDDGWVFGRSWRWIAAGSACGRQTRIIWRYFDSDSASVLMSS